MRGGKTARLGVVDQDPLARGQAEDDVVEAQIVRGEHRQARLTVLGPAEVQADQRCKDLRDANAQMLARFRNQQWDEAALRAAANSPTASICPVSMTCMRNG